LQLNFVGENLVFRVNGLDPCFASRDLRISTISS